MARYSDTPDRDERGRFMSDDYDRDHRSRRSHSGGGGNDYGQRGRGNYDQHRDERGRFMSDDDYRGARGSASSRYESDRRSSSRYDDDYGSDHNQRGWFGDREGHAEAARRGWEDRRNDDDDQRYGSSRYDNDYRSSRGYDDDRGGRYSYDRDDDRGSGSGRGYGYSRDHGQGGWFGDREGHAEAARQGWDGRRDDDRYGSGRGRR